MSESKPFEKYRCERGDEPYVEYFHEPGFRTVYQHDRGEITYMEPFRRLAGKCHLIRPRDDHARTKLLHTLEVVGLASDIARAFGLNVDLTEAIAFGHDLGQPPYGRCGEHALQDLLGADYTFTHAEFGYEEAARHSRVSFESDDDPRYQKLRNLVYYQSGSQGRHRRFVQTVSLETLDGIRMHTPPDHRYAQLPGTMEGQVVRFADNFAYITQEIEDAPGLCVEKFQSLRKWETCTDAGKEVSVTKSDLNEDPVIRLKGVHGKLLDIFSKSRGRRLNVMVERFIYYNASRAGDIKLRHSSILDRDLPRLEYDPLLDVLLDFIWKEYIRKEIVAQPEVVQRADEAKRDLSALFEFLVAPSGYECDPWLRKYLQRETKKNRSWDLVVKIAVAKYVASMTERFLAERLQEYGIERR